MAASSLTKKEQIDKAFRKIGLVRVAEAAQLVSVARSTIYRWIDEEHVEVADTALGLFVNMASLKKHIGPEACKALGL